MDKRGKEVAKYGWRGRVKPLLVKSPNVYPTFLEPSIMSERKAVIKNADMSEVYQNNATAL